jgi:hypothetical protein
VNGDLALRRCRRVKPPGVSESEKTNIAGSESLVNRVRLGPRLRMRRDRHPAVAPSPKAVRWSRDQGCNGHWILRRVPIGGRHPGPKRGEGFHERLPAVVSAVFVISDESREGETNVGKWKSRQGCQRLDRIGAVGRKRPRSSPEAVRPIRASKSRTSDDDPPKRSFERRETFGPPVVICGA